MSEARSILIVEDDESICEVIRVHLEREGFFVDSTPNGTDGLQKIIQGNYSLVILDLQLQGLGGMDICRQVREAGNHVPIIMLTSRSGEIDKVIGLEVGADDYVTKPFSIYELTARIRARLRTKERDPGTVASQENIESAPLVFGKLTIDMVRRKVTVDNKLIELTPKEYEVLVFLAERPGRPFTREDLLESVWQVTATGYADTVAALIRRLRVKLEADPSRPVYVRTVRGVGYRFVERHELSSPAPAEDEGDEDA